MRLIRLAACLAPAVLLTGLCPGRANAGPTGNLLNNPGAEAGSTAGWTVGGDSNPSVDNGTFDSGINPFAGSFDFYGHSGLLGTLTQNVSLTGVPGLSTAQIDGGGLLAEVSFWEQGLNQGSPSDDAAVTLNFLDASNLSLGTVSTPTVDSHDGTWKNFTGDFAIPTGTRSIDYTMQFMRNVGSDNDSFVDDNSLRVVTSSAAVPEPGTFALLGLGLPVLGVAARRRRTAGK